MQEEIWKDIPNYEGFYQISNIGNLRSLPREVIYPEGISNRFFKGKIQNKSIGNNGYVYYDLYRNQERKRFFSHTLVMLCFVRDKNGKEDINHINGIKTDNRVENLEYCSRSENMKHAIKIGLCEKTMIASKRNLKRNYQKVLNTETGIFYNSIKDAANSLNLNKSTLSQRLNGTLKNNTNLIKI